MQNLNPILTENFGNIVCILYYSIGFNLNTWIVPSRDASICFSHQQVIPG